jgi:hypothetical protein
MVSPEAGLYPTKRAFMAAVERGDMVMLYDQSLFSNRGWGTVAEMLEGQRFLTVVGPGPYERRWFASIKRSRAGGLIVR